MYKVLKGFKMNGEIIKYEVQNLENHQTVIIRPSQIEDFSILKEFTNAIPKENLFTKKDDGFEIITIDEMSEEERKERARLFVDELIHCDIFVVGCFEKYIRETPRKYILTALGKTGIIGIYPGTEYFNTKILEKIHFKNVSKGECDFINQYGHISKYEGWNINVPEVLNTNIPKKDFEIDHRLYSTPSVLEKENINPYCVFYIVRIKGNICCNVYIDDNNKILFVEACNVN